LIRAGHATNSWLAFMVRHHGLAVNETATISRYRYRQIIKEADLLDLFRERESAPAWADAF